MTTHSSILSWRSPWTVEPGGLIVHGVAESDMTERLPHAHTYTWDKRERLVNYWITGLSNPVITVVIQ